MTPAPVLLLAPCYMFFPSSPGSSVDVHQGDAGVAATTMPPSVVSIAAPGNLPQSTYLSLGYASSTRPAAGRGGNNGRHA
jgi:hypothetical protein